MTIWGNAWKLIALFISVSHAPPSDFERSTLKPWRRCTQCEIFDYRSPALRAWKMEHRRHRGYISRLERLLYASYAYPTPFDLPFIRGEISILSFPSL